MAGRRTFQAERLNPFTQYAARTIARSRQARTLAGDVAPASGSRVAVTSPR
ncbi:hypothetical protein [Cellulomonas sp. Marseille-Q8402]